MPDEIERFAWLSGTRLGRPVLPLVCRINATSSHVGRVGLAVSRDVAQAHDAGGIHLNRKNWNAVAGGAARFGRPVRRQQQDFCVRVLEEELEFLFPVARIERRGGAGHRGRQKRDDRGQAVRQRHADPIAVANAGGRQLIGDVLHLLAQRAVRHADVLFRNDDGRALSRCRTNQAEQGRRCGIRRCHGAIVCHDLELHSYMCAFRISEVAVKKINQPALELHGL